VAGESNYGAYHATWRAAPIEGEMARSFAARIARTQDAQPRLHL